MYEVDLGYFNRGWKAAPTSNNRHWGIRLWERLSSRDLLEKSFLIVGLSLKKWINSGQPSEMRRLFPRGSFGSKTIKNAKKILTLGVFQSIIHRITHTSLRKDD
jgi:hypothetical protein